MTEEMSGIDVTDIPANGALDPVKVFWQNSGEGKGSATIICWGSAWTCYWGGIGSPSVQEFFRTASTDYLVNKLGYTQWLKQTKAHERYLRRIVEAIKSHLTEPIANGGQA